MKIAVLVSGGVDSSVALKLLKDQDHEVTAFYLKIWLEDELSYLGNCPWQADLAYVRDLCEKLSVPLQVVSLQKEYHDQVVQYMINEIKKGRTPNPDVYCNNRIKFGTFLDTVADQFDKVASGHYANVEQCGDRFVLKQSPDGIKDQSYFLAHLTQKQLSRLIFPIGHLDKKRVRALAEEFDLPTKGRKDSQGICFLGKLKFNDFLRHYCGTKKGELIEKETGHVVGYHEGFWFYTIGQRQGLGLAGGPWYVVAKNPEKNQIIISRSYFSAEKKRDSFYINQGNWFIKKPETVKTVSVKLRHGKHMHQCTIVPDQKGGFLVKLNDRDQGIAAGQYAVFYEDNYCIGSGIIQHAVA